MDSGLTRRKFLAVASAAGAGLTLAGGSAGAEEDKPALLGGQPVREHELPMNGRIHMATPSSAMGDSRLSLPAHTAVPFIPQGPFLGQVPTAPPAAPLFRLSIAHITATVRPSLTADNRA